MRFTNAIDTIGKGVDVVGVATIVVGVVAATVLSLRDQMDAASRYRIFRKRMGRAILLGLELLVAADIIRTVAVTPTLESAGVLAIIVAIRTILSFSLGSPWTIRLKARRCSILRRTAFGLPLVGNTT